MVTTVVVLELVYVRKRLILGALTLVLCASVAVALFTLRDRPTTTPTAAGQPSSPSPTSATRTEAEDVVSLLAGLPAAFQRGDTTALATASPVDGLDLSAVFPSGAVVTADKDSWQRTGAVASITVTVSAVGTADAQHLAILILQPDGWRLSETYPAA